MIVLVSLSMVMSMAMWICCLGLLIMRARGTPRITTSTTSTKTTKTTSGGKTIKTNITFFNDSSSFSGVDLYKYGKSGQTWDGHRLYPAAVHHDHAAEHMYAIFRVEAPDLNPIYVHILDICNRRDAPCTNARKNSRNFLIDVHQTGWSAIGSTTGVIPGTCTRVGWKGPNTIPQSLFLKGGDTYVMCGCTGRCEESDQTWKPVGTC